MAIQDLMIAGEEEIRIKDLYYVLMKNQLGNEKVCKTFIKHQKVRVNGVLITDPKFKICGDEDIYVDEKKINAMPFFYYMMNKPKGYICANYDKKELCVTDIIPRSDCYCLGRLDKDTTGLLILTNDHSLSKQTLLPQNHVDKKYLVTVDKQLTNLSGDFFNGIIIDNDVLCKSAFFEKIDDYHCYVTIHEGKYHQIKKMFLSCGYKVIDLKRISFGNIILDAHLNEGDFRLLTNKEIQMLIGQS